MPNQARILVVDDSIEFRRLLTQVLALADYRADVAEDGRDAIRMLTETRYDLLLLDLKMNPVDGLEVMRAATCQDPDIVAIILTAHGSMDTAVEALRLGAFDYLFKPTPSETLLARVQEGVRQREQSLRKRQILSQLEGLREALLDMQPADERRDAPVSDERYLRTGALIIDRFQRLATLEGRPLSLTTSEYDFLMCLVLAAPQPLSPRELIQGAMGYEASELEARELVKWHVYRLRRKIEPDPADPRYIKSVRNRGYLWCDGGA